MAVSPNSVRKSEVLWLVRKALVGSQAVSYRMSVLFVTGVVGVVLSMQQAASNNQESIKTNKPVPIHPQDCLLAAKFVATSAPQIDVNQFVTCHKS